MIFEHRIAPEARRGKLKEILARKSMIRVMEVHNGLSALIANNAQIEMKSKKGANLEFDAFWISSFTDSAAKGLPDIEILGLDSRIDTVRQVLSVTNKPVIVDMDTGRDPDSFEHSLASLEPLGVSAVVIEDKTYPKRNSLDPDAVQNLEDPKIFGDKIKMGRDALLSEDFMIFARIESLIAGQDVDDALSRARRYLRSGADGVVIHSRSRQPDEVLRFASGYDNLSTELGFRRYLGCIPTTYNAIRDDELQKHGFNIVIYANQLLRASAKSMEDMCKLILSSGRAFEAEPYCSPVKKVADLVGFSRVTKRDLVRFRDEYGISRAIILAAGKPKEVIIQNTPVAMLNIKGKTILRRQVELLKKNGISNPLVVRGYKKEKFIEENVRYLDVTNYGKGSLHSLMSSKDEMEDGFLLIFSDILFDGVLIRNLFRSKANITLVADSSFPLHRQDVDKELDLIIAKGGDARREPLLSEKEVEFIGKKIKKDIATHEFIGLAKFSQEGATEFISVYEECLRNNLRGKFHGNRSFEEASIIDMLEEMIERGFHVHYMETNKGWMEVHNHKDYELAKRII